MTCNYSISFSRTCVIFTLIIFLFSKLVAQDAKSDSLKALLSTTTGKKKVDLLNAISKQNWDRNNDTAIHYARESLSALETLNYAHGLADANRCMGVALAYEAKADEAKPWLEKAMVLYDSLKDEKGVYSTYNNMGLMWSRVSNDSAALLWFGKALEGFRKLGDKPGEGAVLNYIGIVYQKRGDYPKAADYALQGLDARRKTDDYRGTVYSMINAGNMYLEGGQFESALNLFNESIDFAKEHGLEPFDMAYERMGRVYIQEGQFEEAEKVIRKASWINPLYLGQIMVKTGRYDSALKYFERCLPFSTSPESKVDRVAAYKGISEVQLIRGNTGAAMQNARQAFILADSIHHKKFKGDAALILSELYEKAGDFRQSLSYFKLSNAIHDSISGGEFQNKLAFFESKSAIDKEQARVKVLSAEKALQEQRTEEQRKNKNLILLMSLIALGAAAAVIFNIQRQKKRIQAQSAVIEEQNQKVETALSELKSTQAQLIQKEKMASLGELTAGVAHEIQNPLNFVNNFSELNRELVTDLSAEINNGNLDAAKVIALDIASNEEKINEHGRRADAIVKGMLQHSRASTGVMEPTDINLLCDEYLQLCYLGFRAKDKSFVATLKTNFDPHAGKIKIIPQDVGRALLNLCNNAFYAVNEKRLRQPQDYEPSVSVGTKKTGSTIEIKVVDNGDGIPEKNMKKIFQPFFTTKPTGRGTGLGLSLSYDIIVAHGGQIDVHSKEGEGTEFIIRFG